MTKSRILSEEEITQAKKLKEQGLTNRKIAEVFDVGKTTIWDNIYRQEKRIRVKLRPQVIYRFRKIKIVLMAVNKMRADGYNSQQISEFLNIPLDEVNTCITHGFKEFYKRYPKYFI